MAAYFHCPLTRLCRRCAGTSHTARLADVCIARLSVCQTTTTDSYGACRCGDRRASSCLAPWTVFCTLAVGTDSARLASAGAGNHRHFVYYLLFLAGMCVFFLYGCGVYYQRACSVSLYDQGLWEGTCLAREQELCVVRSCVWLRRGLNMVSGKAGLGSYVPGIHFFSRNIPLATPPGLSDADSISNHYLKLTCCESLRKGYILRVVTGSYVSTRGHDCLIFTISHVSLQYSGSRTPHSCSYTQSSAGERCRT